MDVETFEVRLARPTRGDPWGTGFATDLEHAGAGARPERDPSLDRRAADAGQGGRLLGERVDVARVIDVEAAADKEPLDAAIDAGEQPCDFLVAQRLGGVERERAVGSLDEYAVQDEGMEVDVQLKAAPEALDHCDGSAPPIGHTRAARSAAVEAQHGADGHAEDARQSLWSQASR